MFDRLTNVVGRAAGIGRFLFVHILGDFHYANHRVGLRDQLVDLPLSFQDELYGYESLWVRSRLISLFGVNQPTGHCMQTILNFQIAAIAMDENKPRFEFFPFLVSDTRDGLIGDYGYDGEPALMFEKGLNSSIRDEITQSLVSLLMSDPDSLGVFFDYMACEYDGSIDTIECDGKNFRREYLGYLFPPHPDDLYHDDLDGWWPFKLPRAKGRQNNPMDTKRRIDRLDFQELYLPPLGHRRRSSIEESDEDRWLELYANTLMTTNSQTPGTFGGAILIALFAVAQGFFFSYLRHDIDDLAIRCLMLYGPLLITLSYIVTIELLKYRRISLGSPDLPVLSIDSVLTLVLSLGAPYIASGLYFILKLFAFQSIRL